MRWHVNQQAGEARNNIVAGITGITDHSRESIRRGTSPHRGTHAKVLIIAQDKQRCTHAHNTINHKVGSLMITGIKPKKTAVRGDVITP